MRPKKSFGQNFLHDRNIAARIVRELSPRAGETVIEIGPGTGALTGELLGSVSRLFAVELDRELIPVLNQRFGGYENFTLVEADALVLDYCALIAPAVSARVVANLPYNISTPILQHLIAHRRCLTEMVLMLQREVVARIVAPPSTGERGYLSVLAQLYCEVESLFDVSPGAFHPVPKVWSTIVRLRVREHLNITPDEEKLVLELASAGFAQRRKTILNNMRAAGSPLREKLAGAGDINSVLRGAGIVPERRAETLELHEWLNLARALIND